MSIDKFENQFLDKKKKVVEGLNISFTPLTTTLGFNTLPYGKVIEIRAKELSGIFLSLRLSEQKDNWTFLIDADKTFDPYWCLENKKENLFFTATNDYLEIFNYIDNINQEIGLKVNTIIFNSILGILPIDGKYEEFEKYLSKLINQTIQQKRNLIFLNPYLDNRYDIISKYADLIIINKKRTSIKKNEERLGYNVDSEIVKNTVNYNLGKYNFQLFYKEGIK